MNSTPHIVVLDGHTLNPGDLSWQEFESLGSCTIHARTDSARFMERAQEATILLTNKTPITAEQIRQLPHLRFIGVLATGYNIVDVAAARAAGISVSNVPAYGTASVAQHVFSLLLELTSRTAHHASSVREGRWEKSSDWCYWDHKLIELAGLNFGIVGAGRIGRAVGRIGEAFGMNVQFATSSGGSAALETVLRSSDVVTLHCPLNESTKGLMNRKSLGWMKASAYLINTSRGPLIDEQALADALNENQLCGAGLDVLSSEPPSPSNPLLQAKNCFITPHLAWATFAARSRLITVAFENVRQFLSGSAQNVIN